MRKFLFMAPIAVYFALLTAVNATTLDDVRKKGFVQCGVSQGLKGFSSPDDKGDWTGIDVDLCRAIAAAAIVVHKSLRRCHRLPRRTLETDLAALDY